MTGTPDPDSLHRLVKQAMDSGRAPTFEEARSLFEGYRLAVDIADATDAHAQAALLTTVALARRVFLGGVFVSGNLNAAQLTPLPLGPALSDAVIALGARIGAGDGLPRISIARSAVDRQNPFHIRTHFDGWRGGCVPAEVDLSPTTADPMSLSPMLGAAFAVSEAYIYISGQSTAAGRRPAGASLWKPSSDWLTPEPEAPRLSYLPKKVWLIGLGHLGQAYLWALGLLPYSQPAEVGLVLQDMDVVSESSESTSILSDSGNLGMRKTRAMAVWAGRRGFSTDIHERLFDEDYRRQASEPAVALCGLDNALGRRALDKAGFDFVVEAGLGRDHRNFQTMRLHTLPASRSAADVWRGDSALAVDDKDAYRDLLGRGRLDQCGVTLLAGKAVGAPFVGSVAACLAVSELLRLLAGGPLHEIIDLDLRAPDHLVAVAQPRDFSTINPGFVVV